MQVSDPMSTDTVTIKRNDRLILADHAMQERAIRHLPALDESGQVCGFLSQRDLFRGALLKNFGVWGTSGTQNAGQYGSQGSYD